MRTRTKLIIITLAVACAFALGLFGGSFAGAEEAAEPDRLAGVFITGEYLDLFDIEGYLNDNAQDIMSGGGIDGDDEAYRGRLWAARDENGDYSFDGVDGILYGCVFREDGVNIMGGDGISEGHSDLKSTDEGESVTLEGTVYMLDGGIEECYVNPVYQTPGGELYAESGNGMSVADSESTGVIMSHTLTADWETDNNGVTEKNSMSVTIHLAIVSPPETVVIRRYAADGALLASADYRPGETPETLSPGEDCAYIIAETRSRDGLAARRLYTPADGYIITLAPMENGILCERWTELAWPGGTDA